MGDTQLRAAPKQDAGRRTGIICSSRHTSVHTYIQSFFFFCPLWRPRQGATALHWPIPIDQSIDQSINRSITQSRPALQQSSGLHTAPADDLLFQQRQCRVQSAECIALVAATREPRARPTTALFQAIQAIISSIQSIQSIQSIHRQNIAHRQSASDSPRARPAPPPSLEIVDSASRVPQPVPPTSPARSLLPPRLPVAGIQVARP